MEKLMKVMFAITMALSLTNCAEKKDNNNNQAAVPTYGQYYYSNGQCVSAANPTLPVPSTYCANGAMGGQYYYSNGQCVSAANPTMPVPSTYCQNGGMGGAQVCVGQYYYCPGGAPMGGMGGGNCQLGTCQINPQTGLNNCSGYTLYNQSFQPVMCQ